MQGSRFSEEARQGGNQPKRSTKAISLPLHARINASEGNFDPPRERKARLRPGFRSGSHHMEFVNKVRSAIFGRKRLFIAALLGAVVFFLLPSSLTSQTRAIIAWDAFVTIFMSLIFHLFTVQRPQHMPADAAAQEEGEWTIFWITVGAVTASFAAIIYQFSASKGLEPAARSLHVGLVAFTLFASWLMTHVVFCLRYAHEFYETSPGGTGIEGGLEFPGDTEPDYWDFMYFALVLGMTFQVSDVVITSRTLRRVAMLHGLLGFLFNTVVIALTVNIGASLL
eukprot:gene18235-18492_t